MSDELINRAQAFATGAHKAIAQKRKYTGKCYTTHLIEVAEMVADNSGSDEMIAAAFLHDVVEDTAVSQSDIEAYFPKRVADLVFWLTDRSKPSDGNRGARKAIDRNHLSMAPADAQTIKYCDLISNTSTIVEHDPKFAEVYLDEKRLLLGVMTEGNEALLGKARALIAELDKEDE